MKTTDQSVFLQRYPKFLKKVPSKEMTSYFNDIFSKLLSGFHKKYG